MSKKAGVPSAWDDDWELQADKVEAEEKKQPSATKPLSRSIRVGTGGPTDSSIAAAAEAAPQLTRAERLAKHEEENRRLWNSADNPEEFHFLTMGAAPGGGALLNTYSSGSSGPALLASASAFRPPMTLLSRKPAPRALMRRDPVTGIEQLMIHDDAAEAEAEAAAAAARNQETPDQIRQRLQRERDVKQRKYDEARAKIFGEPLPAGGGSSSNNNSNNNTLLPGLSLPSSRQSSPVPRSSTEISSSPHPQQPQQQQQQQQSNGQSVHHNNSYNGRGRGRGRGQSGSNRGDRAQYDNGSRRQFQPNQQQYSSNSPSQASTPTPQSPSQQADFSQSGSRVLYDPNYSPKPQRRHQNGGGQHRYQASGTGSASGSDASGSPFPSRTATPREEDFVVRAPRGPDGSGRGGFGFARRGLKSG
ncbi:hypothetical protein SEPCBS119000_004217 [Sporothrix epigloea]|uniref:SUZ-C domain-containing protein n=1 Tax=Sporothrix epigloea TaxID=1892477 RepID=A0ABP0DUZ0_9PEZI